MMDGAVMIDTRPRPDGALVEAFVFFAGEWHRIHWVAARAA